ncbi:hypothetical protein K2173_007962 [Erythroxylum novogranatense]|uniref:Uncharacterized protein n=1 Tax=Erythroxylum novogranatense TaxID=1862640 RepID=A0AAV8T7E7_9ROSI|nr:hypothetical protein K2173_007962 [Erythroxylum novogranatense]
MEDSEKRRERLRAMRTVAAEAEGFADVEASARPSSLANPLLEDPTSLGAPEDSVSSQRFDFYTDPMAAFSTNKKRNVAANHTHSSTSGFPVSGCSSPYPRPANPDTNFLPVHQMHSSYTPNNRLYQAHLPHESAAAYTQPRGMVNSFPIHQGIPPPGWNGSGGQTTNYNSIPQRGLTSPYPMHQVTPGFGSVRGGSFNFARGNAHGFGNTAYPGSVQQGFPASNSEGGRGRWHGGRANSSSRWSGGRGQAFHSHKHTLHETFKPGSFYDKSMVEDPWQHLEPVMWKGLNPTMNSSNVPGSSNSWLPKSISMKKQRVSDSCNKSNSQQSLAEYLAASLNEATKDTQANDC